MYVSCSDVFLKTLSCSAGSKAEFFQKLFYAAVSGEVCYTIRCFGFEMLRFALYGTKRSCYLHILIEYGFNFFKEIFAFVVFILGDGIIESL